MMDGLGEAILAGVALILGLLVGLAVSGCG